LGLAAGSLNRRQFLHVTGGTVLGSVALSLTVACTPAASTSPTPAAASTKPTPVEGAGATAVAPAPTAAQPAVAATGRPAGAAFVLPTYVPTTGGQKPDFPARGPQYQDGFLNYPANPVKVLPAQPPGAGGTINVFIAAYYPPPTPFDQNRAWQEVNKQLGATVQMNIIPFAEFNPKLATLMAGGEPPDIIHLVGGANAAVNSLPQFLEAQCADLTPYVSGDAVKEYPNLAALPTIAWRNTAVFNNKLLAVPVSRPSVGTGLFKINEIYDKEIGENYLPKNAADYKRVLQQLNRPQENRWATASYDLAYYDIFWYAALFGAPNNWKLDGSKLIKDYETEEFKAAVDYVRDPNAAGLFHPNTNTYNIISARGDFIASRFAVHAEGWAPWNDFWRQGRQQTPAVNFGHIYPFPAQDGGKPVYYLYQGFVAATAMKRAAADRVREILRIMNWLAAPFGSAEDALLTYGIKDVHYTVDDKGNPKPTANLLAEARYVPWQYVTQRPQVHYIADIPGYVEAAVQAEQTLVPLGVGDPTLGFYSPLQGSKGPTIRQTMLEGVRDIIAGRRPMSDYDTLVKAWTSGGGEQIRKEFSDAIAARGT